MEDTTHYLIPKKFVENIEKARRALIAFLCSDLRIPLTKFKHISHPMYLMSNSEWPEVSPDNPSQFAMAEAYGGSTKHALKTLMMGGDPVTVGSYLTFEYIGLTYLRRALMVWHPTDGWLLTNGSEFRGEVEGWIGPLPHITPEESKQHLQGEQS